MVSHPTAGRLSYAGLFFVALSTLMYEVLLTRIFSVTMYYHFAFVAVSVALFGMTMGAVIVYLFPRIFKPEKAERQMALASLAFGLTVVVTFIAHLKSHATPSLTETTLGLLALAKTYSLIAIPFIFSGIAICLALTQFPKQVSRLYAADLAGAALGCVLFVLTLRVTDGPTAVLVVSTLAILGALLFALDSAGKVIIALTALVFIGATGVTVLNGYRVERLAQIRTANVPYTVAMSKAGRHPDPKTPWIGIAYAKGIYDVPPLFEEWNSYSRIKAEGDPWYESEPAGWGMSAKWRDDPAVSPKVRQLYMNIDSGAGTYMTHFAPKESLELLRMAHEWEAQRIKHGDDAWHAKNAGNDAKRGEHERLQRDAEAQRDEYRRQASAKVIEEAREQAAFLRYDVTNFAHLVRPDSRVLVIGAGGGRDVLSALVFGQKHVIGVEINDAIIKATTRVFGDFTGHLDWFPNVKIVHDEARSFITRLPKDEHVDLIQISLIDTWAATAAGAFVLSENSLYTVEAWKTFFNHLTDRGILTVTRWYHPKKPGETLRIVSLANQSLRDIGVSDPRKHIVIVKSDQKQESTDIPDAVANTMVSRTPFSDADLDRIEAEAKKFGFQIVLSPRSAETEDLKKIADAKDVAAAAKEFPINLAPPTDNQPFFFNMTRMRDAFAPGKWMGQGHDVNLRAVMVVAGLLVFVIVLSLVFIVLPVMIRAEKGAIRNNLALSAFFVCIGLGFILVEIAQMQRLIILLGHPTYSLSVVLAAVLVASGIGSFTTKNLSGDSAGSIVARFMLLLIALGVTGYFTPMMIQKYVSAATPVRIGIALLLLMPAGLFMGMCFPIGMKVAALRRGDLSAWLWGINGAMSVVASVLCIVIAMSFGISAAWWTGVGCYVVATVMILMAGRKAEHPTPNIEHSTSNQAAGIQSALE